MNQGHSVSHRRIATGKYEMRSKVLKEKGGTFGLCPRARHLFSWRREFIIEPRYSWNCALKRCYRTEKGKTSDEVLVRPISCASWQSGAGIPTNQTISFPLVPMLNQIQRYG